MTIPYAMDNEHDVARYNRAGYFNSLLEIMQMNDIMELPVNTLPTNLGHTRIHQFKKILGAELEECEDFVDLLASSDPEQIKEGYVHLADWLADLIVYVVSESVRWGIPIGIALYHVMESQQSKLVNGKPVPGDMPGKFGKGPNYHPPEPAIRETIETLLKIKKQREKANNG